MSKIYWNLDEGKFLTKHELKKIRNQCEKRKNKALETGARTPIKEWFVMELVFETGLRVEEISKLKCSDLFISPGKNSIVVREGKNKKPRVVKIRERFRMIIREYLTWKEQTGESTVDDSPVIYSSYSKGHMSKRGLQKIFERCAKRAGITNHSIHHCRHTYASAILEAGKSTPETLVFLKNQLGHSSIKTTEQYLHVAKSRKNKILERLYQ